MGFCSFFFRGLEFVTWDCLRITEDFIPSHRSDIAPPMGGQHQGPNIWPERVCLGKAGGPMPQLFTIGKHPIKGLRLLVCLETCQWGAINHPFAKTQANIGRR